MPTDEEQRTGDRRQDRSNERLRRPAFLFDLDGTLVVDRTWLTAMSTAAPPSKAS